MSDHRCELIYDADGKVIARAHVSPDITDQERSALGELIAAAIRLRAEEDAADPVAAAERARRQASLRGRRWLPTGQADDTR